MALSFGNSTAIALSLPRRPSILLIEEDDEVCEGIARMLEKGGYHVVSIANEVEASRAIANAGSQVAQTAACNRAHTLNERLARWLLLTHDRVAEDRFESMHEFLDRMLGTRRAGVSVAAGALRDTGVIDYARGQVTIVDRKGLENASCECYQIVKTEFDRLFA